MTEQEQLSFKFQTVRSASAIRVVIRNDRPTRKPATRAGELVEIRRGEVQMIDRTRAWRKYEGRMIA